MNYTAFLQTIASAGFNPPDYIAPGKFYRYAGLDKKPSNKAGYCLLFDDCRAGIFGDFSTGFKQTWLDGSSRELTLNERMKLQDQIRIAKGHREADEAIIQGDVADEALKLWQSASTAIQHPYQLIKRIIPYGARQLDTALLIPMLFNGKLVNLQHIYAGGGKYPMKGGRVKGCYFPVGEIDDFIYVCEGFATACSLHEYTGKPCVVAFNADGLKTVALAIKKSHPRANVTIACDNDINTKGNPGLTMGFAAATAVCGDSIYPVFPDGSSLTDFNDYLTQGGVEVMRNTTGELASSSSTQLTPMRVCFVTPFDTASTLEEK